MQTRAIDCTSLNSFDRTRARNGLEQELENFDVPLRLTSILAPGIKSMTAKQETVRVRVLPESFGDAVGQRPHVLRVLDDGNPLAVLVRLYAFETFQHL